MSLSVTLIAVKNEVVSSFIKSNEYKSIKENLIFREIKNDDGLFMMFNANQSIDVSICSTLNEKDYLLIDVDDSNGFYIQGGWVDIPEYIQVSNRMMILIKCKSKEEFIRFNNQYDTDEFDKLPENEVQNISDLIIDYGDYEDIPDSSDCEGLEKQKIERLEKVVNHFEDDDVFREKWTIFKFKSDCEKFDTSKSKKDDTFVVQFDLTLRNVLKWKDWIEGELEEWSECGKEYVAWSVFDTENYELIEEFSEENQYETEELFNYPSIYCENYVGHPSFPENWELNETKGLVSNEHYTKMNDGVDVHE